MGQVCLVTGAGRGLGRAVALALADEGAAVLLHCNRSHQGARLLRDLIRGKGGVAHVRQADLTCESSRRRLVRETLRLLGRIDILVNSAGIFAQSDLASLTSQKLDHLFAVNLTAPILLSRDCSGIMISQGSGRIINISSLGAFKSWPKYLGYCASKAALVSATRTMARALAPHILVNSVAPGFIDLPTDLRPSAKKRLIAAIPAQRTGSYQNIVDAVLYFCTAEYVTGQILAVDGGASLV